mmetsp:Transcript_2233/g.4605  ORF Transcript_2233/g.4605 Transcript_2233/m.4605 type:complete len:82 (+) Transcript_2233:144-389(+)
MISQYSTTAVANQTPFQIKTSVERKDTQTAELNKDKRNVPFLKKSGRLRLIFNNATYAIHNNPTQQNDNEYNQRKATIHST